MNVRIICEKAYASSIWCEQLVSGIVSELKRKRQQYIKSCETDDIENNSVIYLIGANYHWLSHTIQECNLKGIVPIVLCNQDNRMIRGRYHCVCADIYGSMKQLCDHFLQMQKTRIALYGVNPSSVSDQSRMECFLEVTADKDSIFENNGNLEECYQNFLPCIHSYEVVICVNSYAAISLVNKLKVSAPDILGRIHIVSCTKTILSAWYSQWISFIELHLENFGKAAIAISELAESTPNIAAVTITIEGDLSEVTQKMNADAFKNPYDYKDLFYEDSEWMDLSKIEHMLHDCSELDRQILALLLRGATYSQIAEECYVAEGTIKYHIKKYMEACQVKTKQELLDVFTKAVLS